MSGLENSYRIEDLYIVKFQSEYKKKYQEEDFENFFNPNFYFIVEKFSYEVSKKETIYVEDYAECITGYSFYMREADSQFSSYPEVFSSFEQLPVEYLNEEEKETGIIKTLRIFQIFQEINTKQKVLRR